MSTLWEGVSSLIPVSFFDVFFVVVIVVVGSVIFKYGLNSLMSFLSHPDEFFHLLYFMLFLNRKQNPPEGSSKAEVYCYEMLLKVSRSFAAVIMELPEDLKEAVLIFYLVLRALDSIEDDMSVPLEKKIPHLRSFYVRLDEPGYTLKGIGEKDTEKDLLEHYDRVIEFYGKLDKNYQAVIQDICRRMGAGMADFTQKKVESIRDYELYCHYVAGLVGIGLTQLFAHSQYEDESLLNKEFEKTANSMGLFLQVLQRFFFPSFLFLSFSFLLSFFLIFFSLFIFIFNLNEDHSHTLLFLTENKHHKRLPRRHYPATTPNLLPQRNLGTIHTKVRKLPRLVIWGEASSMLESYGC